MEPGYLIHSPNFAGVSSKGLCPGIQVKLQHQAVGVGEATGVGLPVALMIWMFLAMKVDPCLSHASCAVTRTCWPTIRSVKDKRVVMPRLCMVVWALIVTVTVCL